MDDYRLIATEEDLQEDVENEEEEDDDYEDEYDDYEDENDDYEDEDEDEEAEDYEGEEVDEVIPSETMVPRVSSSIADGSVADSNVCNVTPVSQQKEELNRGVIDVCPICFEACSSDGDHRFCCLPCGHVYGMSCIKRWLQRCQSSGKCSRCPHCKSFCTLKDVIVLYATRLCVADEMSPEAWDWRSDMQRLQNRVSQLEVRIQAGQIEREEWQRQMMEEWQRQMRETQIMMEEKQQQMMEEMQRCMTESFKQSGNHPGSLPP